MYPLAACRGHQVVAAANGGFDPHVETYSDRVLASGTSGPVLYWPLWETSGVLAEELVTSAHGTYTADVADIGTMAGIGDTNTAVYFDKVNFLSVYSETFESVWNGDEFTILYWCKYDEAAMYDERARRTISFFADGDNKILASKSTSEGDFANSREAQGLYRAMWARDLIGEYDWSFYAMTMSLSNNRQYGYRNGVQVDEELGLLLAWDPEVLFDSDYVRIGTETDAVGDIWDGGICHVAIFDEELSAVAILDLASV